MEGSHKKLQQLTLMAVKKKIELLKIHNKNSIGLLRSSPFQKLRVEEWSEVGAAITNENLNMKPSKSKDKDIKLCARCNEPIEKQWLSALGKTWHPEHFTCERCHVPIVENQFKAHENKPYCKQCFLEMYGKKCKKCDVLIDGCKEKCVMALGAHWHSEHFSCESCQKVLDKVPFYEQHGEPYCKECYENLFCPKCKGCKKPISDSILTALDSQWHQQCFKCSKCKQQIGSSAFGMNAEGNPLCEKCLQ